MQERAVGVAGEQGGTKEFLFGRKGARGIYIFGTRKLLRKVGLHFNFIVLSTFI